MMKVSLRSENGTFEIQMKREEDQFILNFLKKSLPGKILHWTPPRFTLQMGKENFTGAFYRGKNFADVHLPQGNFRLKYSDELKEGRVQHTPGEMTAPMPGKILKVLVAPGDKVQKGQTLMILEAMKMEHKILSPLKGKVDRVFFNEGDRVGQDVELLEISEGS